MQPTLAQKMIGTMIEEANRKRRLHRDKAADDFLLALDDYIDAKLEARENPEALVCTDRLIIRDRILKEKLNAIL